MLIGYIEANKKEENDWFTIEPVDEMGLRWAGKCWLIYDMVRYEYAFEFEVVSADPALLPAGPD